MRSARGFQALSSVAVCPARIARRCTEPLHPDARAHRSKTALFSRAFFENRPHKPKTRSRWTQITAGISLETPWRQRAALREGCPRAPTSPPEGSSEADSKKRAPTPESDDNSAELICKPQPKKPKTQKKPKVPVTKESVIENCKDGDAYVAKVLGTDKVDASQLLFCIISKGRWANARTVEARLIGGGLPPAQILWLVGTEREEYEANCAGSVVEGGGLCQSRNRALDEARARKLGCVQMSDDMKRCEIIRCGDSLQSFHDRGHVAETEGPEGRERARCR